MRDTLCKLAEFNDCDSAQQGGKRATRWRNHLDRERAPVRGRRPYKHASENHSALINALAVGPSCPEGNCSGMNARAKIKRCRNDPTALYAALCAFICLLVLHLKFGAANRHEVTNRRMSGQVAFTLRPKGSSTLQRCGRKQHTGVTIRQTGSVSRACVDTHHKHLLPSRIN